MLGIRCFVILSCALALGRKFICSTAYRINVRSETPFLYKQSALFDSYSGASNENSRSIESAIVLAEANRLHGESYMDNLVMGLNSLKDKNSNDVEVLAHLSTIVPHFEAYNGSLSSAQISAALYGLQGMNSDFLEVSGLLSALLGVMDVDTGTFEAREVGRALYGLRCMRVNSPEVVELLSVLGPRIERCTCILDSVYLGMAFDGLQGIRGSSEVSSIMSFLYRQLNSLVISTDQLKDLSCEDLILLGRQLALTPSELIEAFNDEHPKWEEINLIIADEIARRFSCDQFSLLDTVYPDNLVYSRSLESQYVTLSSRFNLLGAYDCRVMSDKVKSEEPVFSRLAAREGDISSVRFCMSRDKHLSSNLNSIEGIGAKHLRTVDPLEFDSWLLSRVGITG